MLIILRRGGMWFCFCWVDCVDFVVEINNLIFLMNFYCELFVVLFVFNGGYRIYNCIDG